MKTHYLYWISIGVLFVLLIFQTCSKMELERNSELNFVAYNDTIENYKTSIGQLVESKRSITLEKDQYKLLSDSLKFIIKNFKKPKNIIEWKWKIKTDTIRIPLVINPDNTFSFKYEDEFFIRAGRVLNREVKLDPLVVKNTTSIVSGYKRTGLFKPNEYRIDISNSNPYIKSESIQHYTIVDKKRWYEKWWIIAPVGFGFGAFMFK